jgi:hypothetical protein
VRRKTSTRSSTENGLGKARALPNPRLSAFQHAARLRRAACQQFSKCLLVWLPHAATLRGKPFRTLSTAEQNERKPLPIKILLQVVKARMAVTEHRSTHTPKSPIPHLM